MKLASKTITTIRKKDISKHLKNGHPQNIVTLLWGAEGEYQTLKKYSLSSAYLIWCGIGIILTTIMDNIIYKEIITTKKIFGAIIIICGMGLTK